MREPMSAVEKQKQRRLAPGMKKLLIHEVPIDLKRMFKERCVVEGDTMRSAILKFMYDYVTRKKGKKAEL